MPATSWKVTFFASSLKTRCLLFPKENSRPPPEFAWRIKKKKIKIKNSIGSQDVRIATRTPPSASTYLTLIFRLIRSFWYSLMSPLVLKALPSSSSPSSSSPFTTRFLTLVGCSTPFSSGSGKAFAMNSEKSISTFTALARILSLIR
ncbi:MAG: hypothetical protein BWX66_01892 [Deltaproteobacteria bacterium ADurb.Bin058]|nr:MAG: hypothetical protein BWX66_01892 [Deltaproteobacteria bacterium ADurb.Bin058]